MLGASGVVGANAACCCTWSAYDVVEDGVEGGAKDERAPTLFGLSKNCAFGSYVSLKSVGYDSKSEPSCCFAAI